MTLIEGVGDEVTQFFVIVVVILIGLVAWWSTSIADQPLIRTVLILERRTRRRVNAEPPPTPPTTTSSLESSIDTGQLEGTAPNDENQEVTGAAACQICDKATAASASSSSALNNTEGWQVPESNADNGSARDGSPSRQSSSLEHTSGDLAAMTDDNQTNVNNGDSYLLRRRRLAFFQSRQVTLLDSPVMDGTVISASSSTDSEGIEASVPMRQENEITQTASEPMDESPSADSIRIRLKYLNDDQKLVEGRLQEQLGDFKRRHFSLEMSADKLVRLIFNGQVLQSDSETLQGYGLFDNCVVHCLVHQQRSSASNQSGSNENHTNNDSANNLNNSGENTIHRDWDLGNVLLASLSLLVGLAWYCRYQYAQLFNATTTVALVGLTGILTVSLVGIYLPDQDGIRQ